MSEDLGSLFMAAVARHGPRPACEVAERTLTYHELGGLASRMAGLIGRESAAPAGPSRPVLLAASRSLSGYLGLLGALLAGNGYIPLNPSWPAARWSWLIRKTGARIVIADPAGLEMLGETLEAARSPLLVVLPDVDDVSGFGDRWPAHRFLGSGELGAAPALTGPQATPSGVAYTLFTSGSTGDPKGVRISHAASVAMIRAMADRYPCDPEARFTQFSDFTWDPSVVDMFMAWQSGGCVCCPSAKAALMPDKFILGARATVTHLVPTTLRNLQRRGALQAGRFPLLRYVFVGGEPFPAPLAADLQEAAPDARIVNIYGSQEYSIFSTFDWDSRSSPAHCLHGILPLGSPFPGSALMLDGGDLPDGSTVGEGELCVSGPQLFSGYFEDEGSTRAALRTGPAPDHRLFYRTGDRVRQATGFPGICYLGRKDSQIKLAGIRIELGEVEAALKQAAATDAAVALGWPLTDSGAEGIVAFVAGSPHSAETIQAALRARLPRYMLPKQIHLEPDLPRNANGKCDRKALADRLRGGGGAAALPGARQPGPATEIPSL